MIIRARLLGGFEVEVDGRRVERFRTQRTALLLAYLVRYPQPHARDELARLFWGELADEAALNNLRVSLSSLRAILEPPGVPRGSVLQTTRRTVGLNPAQVETDVAQFEAAAAQAQSAPSESERTAWANRARTLYQGEFLSGYDAPWVSAERERLRALCEALPPPSEPAPEPATRPARPAPTGVTRPVGGLGVVVGVKLPTLTSAQRGWLRSAIAVCGGATLDALPEGALVFFTDLDKLARFLHEAAQRHPDALIALDLGHLRVSGQRYEGAPRRVVERMLQAGRAGQALCTQRVASVLTQASLGKLPEPRPLGAYWLSAEFPHEAIFMVELPGLSGLPVFDAPPALSKHLPRVGGSFIGRDTELAMLLTKVQQTPSGLFTILGAPGCGKTRFALEAAWRMEPLFGEARWWIALTHPTESLDEAWARRLGWGTAAPQQFHNQLYGVLGAQRALLVTDWLHPPSEAQREELRALRRALPTLTVLASAPCPLQLEGEQVIELAPLATPPEELVSVDELWRFSAVRLFVERAIQSNPDFRFTEGNAPLIAELSRLLSGLPLAIELAAARLRSVPLAQLLQHLEDARLWKRPAAASAFGRSLWDSLTASYTMLSPPQQTLLNRLSLLPGGWTQETVRAVLGVEGEELDALTRTGLLHAHGERYETPHLVRQFVAQHLTSDDRRTVLSHFTYYWCERIETKPPQQVDWAILEFERTNLDTALEWSAEHEPLIALRLALALAPFWEARGGSQRALHALVALPHCLTRPEEQLQAARIAVVFATRRGATAEARQLLDAFLPLANAYPQLIQAARLWFAAGFYYWVAGDLRESERYLRLALERSRALHAPDDQAETLLHLGVTLWIQERLDEAAPLLEQAIELASETTPRLRLNALGNLASIRYQQGDLERAELLLHEAQALAQQQGDLRTLATMLNNWGVWRAEHGDYERAYQLYHESLALWRKIGEPMGETVCLNNLGDLAMREGDHETARSLFLHSLEMAQRYRVRWYLYHPQQNLAQLAEREGNWKEATLWARRALHALLQHQSMAQARPLLQRIARCALAAEDYTLAARCLAAAERLCPAQKETLHTLKEQFARRADGATRRILKQFLNAPLEELLNQISLQETP